MSNNYFYKKIWNHLKLGYTAKSGRNNLGRICVYHRGGGHKRNYKLIDFFRRINEFGYIIKLLKDNFRTSFIGLIIYNNGLVANISIAEGVKKGELLYSGNIFPEIIEKSSPQKGLLFQPGTALPLKFLQLFTKINNIEQFPRSGAVLCRSAGVSAIFAGRTNFSALIKLTSGWQSWVSIDSMATIGVVSNYLHKYENIQKAGVSRWRGFRPVVRGVIKNPCDHPHGGGEGRGSPPRAQVSPWGKLTKGTPTTNKKQDRLKRRLFKTV